MNNSNPHTVCIIGGGMSGLFTGALLAKNGYKVTVLEKNHIIGGGLQSFVRDGVTFVTGMQAFAGYEKHMISYQFFQYLGINSSLNILPTDPKAQEIVWQDKDHCYHLPKGKQAYEDYLIRIFPHERKGIKELLDLVFEIGHTFDYLFLNPIQRHESNVPYAYMSAEELVRQYIKDERLISIFSFIGYTTGHSLQAMPALEFGMMLTLYITDSHRFVGGTKQVVNALREIIESNKGQIVNNTEIRTVQINDGKVELVIDSNGIHWSSETYIWACTPKLLLEASNYPIFRISMSERIKEYVNPFTFYIIYCKLKEKKFRFINSSVTITKKSVYKNLPQSLIFVTQPTHKDQVWAETMDIYVPTSYEEVSKWSNSMVEKRGKDYNEMKQKIAYEVIELITEYYPKLENAIDSIYVASALTIRDYYGNPQGAVYGQQGLYVPVRTRVANLFMTGQSVQNQGIAGIATTATLTAEAIMKKSLIEEIAKA